MLFAKQPEPETLTSRLMPDLFDVAKLEEGKTIRVLDFGPANADTFHFLNRFNCRLQILDIRNKLIALNELRTEDPDFERDKVRDYLVGALGLREQDIFDVCLMWDFMNYLDVTSISVLAEVLLPHLSGDAKLHGFAVLNKNTALKEQNYGIVDAEMLSVSDQSRTELPYRHSQSGVNDAMKDIRVKQSILREDGRLEMVLTAV